MSRKYKFRDNDKLYFVTFAVIHWIDLFIREEYRKIMLDSWKYCMQNKGMELYGWCIMTSHIHLIIGSHEDKLEKIMQNMKRHTSEELNKAIRNHPQESRKEWIIWMMERAGKKNNNNINFQLWQQHNNPVELSNQQMAWQKLEYIHQNPVKAGVVEKPEDYLYSSARSYYGMKGLIEIDLLDPLIITI
ncbi:MAG: transposase [Parafilimonas sp.]|nr:transposase [Parafilimonas sp.]